LQLLKQRKNLPLGVDQSGEELSRRPVSEVIRAIRIVEVEAEAVGLDVGHGYPPRPLTLLPIRPPGLAVGELLEAQRLGLRILLAPLWRRHLVVPDLLRPPRLLEEQEVRGYGGVGLEDTVGEADDRVQVALGQKLLLDASTDTVAEQDPVGYDDAAPAAVLELADDQL